MIVLYLFSLYTVYDNSQIISMYIQVIDFTVFVILTKRTHIAYKIGWTFNFQIKRKPTTKTKQKRRALTNKI